MTLLAALVCSAAVAIAAPAPLPQGTPQQEQAQRPLRAVPFPQVLVNDAFFAPRRATNRTVSLLHALDQLEQTGTLHNFDLAAAGKHEGFQGYVFQDSDAYKAMEAVACALAERRDPDLERRLDAVIARVAAAQRPDGYLNTAYTVQDRGERFSNLRDDHELYCAGHLFEAAVAHVQATGKRTLLDVAVRYADLLVRTFGTGDGKRAGYGGHPEIELALVALSRVTAKPEYAALAAHFVRQRGTGFFAREHGKDPQRFDGTYWLDHVPAAALQRIAGHAVRAAYLMSGAADVAATTGDAELLAMTQRVWRNTIGKNVFVTGGIGPSAHNEGFTVDYDLPTFTAYQESCASIALSMWAHRLALLTRDARYADAMETALYNAIPAGVQLDGTRFFYVNPLASRGTHHRRAWFGCACCPPNLARTFAKLGEYVAATDEDTLCVNLYVRGEIRAQVGNEPFALVVTTDYPWDGTVTLRVVQAPRRPVSLLLRVPGWCPRAELACNAEPAAVHADDRGAARYAEIRRQFAPGDTVVLRLPMPVRRLEADPRAEALRGTVAFARGPIVYCAEQVDCGAPVERLVAAPDVVLEPQARPDLLGGVTVLHGELLDCGERWITNGANGPLYREVAPPRRVPVTLVPYAVWDNREAGAMAVWLPSGPRTPRAAGPEATAAIEISFRNWNCDPEGLRDGEEPKKSGDTPPRNCHFWDHAGGTEWVQYVWPAPQRLAGSRVFWFDDTGHGACRLPKRARLLWRDGDAWRPVAVTDADAAAGAEPGAVPIALDRWCEVTFAPVVTTALRLEVEQQDGRSSGVLEWRVVPGED